MLVAAFFIAPGAFAALTVAYHTGDSSKHTFDAVCSGWKAQLMTYGSTQHRAGARGLREDHTSRRAR
jgi:hypothetical protein